MPQHFQKRLISNHIGADANFHKQSCQPVTTININIRKSQSRWCLLSMLEYLMKQILISNDLQVLVIGNELELNEYERDAKEWEKRSKGD
eukprot:c40539_g1_i1 orf=139-408(+)